VLRGVLLPASRRAKVPLPGETGEPGFPLDVVLAVRCRLSIVLDLRSKLGRTKAGSAFRAAAKAGLDGTTAGAGAIPRLDRLLLVEPVRLRLDRPATGRPGALMLNTLALAVDLDALALASPPKRASPPSDGEGNVVVGGDSAFISAAPENLLAVIPPIG
jgi:hypothetical protein